MLKFPSNFLWGAATAAYQVEGNNSNTDWWAWEKSSGHECSGPACRQYELFASDFDLARRLNHNCHRLSVEWARIEPEEGRFSDEAIAHYIDVVRNLRDRGIEPMVTLHHFTNPLWLMSTGGWEDPKTVERFLRYAQFVVSRLSPYVRYWITINEPTIYLSHSYMFAMWPPQVRSNRRALKVHDNLIKAHRQAYALIHRIYRGQGGEREPMVSLSQHVSAVVPCNSDFRNRLAAQLRDYWANWEILDKCRGTLDFIGINYYSRHLVHVTSWRPSAVMMEQCASRHHPLEKNSLGWDIYPEGLYQLLLKTKRYNLPVIITENGICTSDDDQRWRFIRDHLTSVHRAIQEGVDVRGYLYWSLLDNFEWDKGFGPRFGLIEVDYATFERKVRNSALRYAEVCRTGQL